MDGCGLKFRGSRTTSQTYCAIQLGWDPIHGRQEGSGDGGDWRWGDRGDSRPFIKRNVRHSRSRWVGRLLGRSAELRRRKRSGARSKVTTAGLSTSGACWQ
jgi:hypothetical protein